LPFGPCGSEGSTERFIAFEYALSHNTLPVMKSHTTTIECPECDGDVTLHTKTWQQGIRTFYEHWAEPSDAYDTPCTCETHDLDELARRADEAEEAGRMAAAEARYDQMKDEGRL